MARMTWDQKEYRRDARRHGQSVIVAIAHMHTAQREAWHWRHVSEERTRFWQARSMGHEYTAYTAARAAARAALQSIALDKP